MSYLVLARKYRPSNFDEVIGQEHITELLKKAISSGRIAHAYLFCGPRGIGKTSCARILAKSLNCQKGPTLKPCNKCSACNEIAAGNSFDVLEIDGASNRGIDEIRTLRENVKFAPSYGRYKVYIVDEVHMLTAEAFNALLKTLEEPPEHVKFIFATTDVNKVPSTIISRCQRFDFKRIALNKIIELLSDIAKKEKFKIEEQALTAIAKAAQGSLRDSLSILDQLSALSDAHIKADDVYSMLGLVETNLMFDLAGAISEKNCAKALDILDKIVDKGKDVKQLNKDLIEHFRNMMVIKVGGKALGRLVDYPIAIKEIYLTQSSQFTLKEILNCVDSFIEAQETSRITENLRMPIEIALAKLTYNSSKDGDAVLPSSMIKKQNVDANALPKKHSPAEILKNQKGQADFMPDEVEEKEEIDLVDVALPTSLPPDDDELDLDKIKRSWNALTHAISREKISVATYLQEGIPHEFKKDKDKAHLTVAFPKEAEFHKESIETKVNKKLIEKIFGQKLNSKIIVNFKIVKDFEKHEEAPVVKEALKTFKGKVIHKWHN